MGSRRFVFGFFVAFSEDGCCKSDNFVSLGAELEGPTGASYLVEQLSTVMGVPSTATA